MMLYLCRSVELFVYVWIWMAMKGSWEWKVIMLLVWVGRVNIQYMSIYLDLW